MNLKDYPEYEYIPFELPEVTAHLKLVGGRKVSIVDEQSGEVVDAKELSKQIHFWKDAAPYIKLFPDGISLIKNLSSKGTTLLVFILKRLDIGQVEIELRVSEVLRDNKNLAGGRFYEACEELLKYGYMVKKKGGKNKFFLNPNFFFNGDRKKLKT